MIKSEQTTINGYGNTGGAAIISNNISSGGMAAMNNGSGEDAVNIGT